MNLRTIITEGQPKRYMDRQLDYTYECMNRFCFYFYFLDHLSKNKSNLIATLITSYDSKF